MLLVHGTGHVDDDVLAGSEFLIRALRDVWRASINTQTA